MAFYEVDPNGVTTVKAEMARILGLHRSMFAAAEVAKLEDDDARCDELAEIGDQHGYDVRLHRLNP